MSDASKTAAVRSSPPLYEFGPFRLDSVKRLLLRDGDLVALTPKAVEVLMVLVENRGRALEKDELMRAVWPDTVVEENNLARSVSSLRKALGEKASEHRYVITIPGRGYRFVAPVREVPRVAEEGRAGSAAAQVRDPEERRIDAAEASATPPAALAAARRSTPRLPAIVAALGALATVLVGIGVAWGWRTREPRVRELTALAVLPFDNLSADPEQEYLSDGITETLITELTSVRALHVISRHSVMRYKRSKLPLREIARELRVGAVVAGTVNRNGSRVRVSAQLLDASSGQHLWDASYDREIGDSLALQTDIARSVAREVHAAVTTPERARLARRVTVDSDAYDLYLRGRYFFNRRGAASGEEAATALRKSVTYLEQAIAKEPDLAEAHATLAFAYRVIAYRGFLPPWEATRRSDVHARRSLELDPQLVDAQTATAATLAWSEWDWDAGERRFRRAIELNPGDAHVRLWYSLLLLARGRHEQSLAQSAHGLRNDPFHPLLRDNQVKALVALGRHDEAIAAARESIELDPARAELLGWVCLHVGREQEALAEFERAGSERGLAYVRALRGDLSGIRALLDRLEERGKQTYVSPVEFAKLFAMLGDRDQAFARLEEGYRTRAAAMGGIQSFEEFASLRSDPRYVDLLRRMNLDATP